MRKLAIIGTSLLALSLTNCADDEEMVESPTTASAPQTPAAPPSVQDAADAAKQAMGSMNSQTRYVATDGLKVRKGPGVSHAKVSELQFGQEVKVLTEGQWTKIEGGYVYGEYLKAEKPSAPIQNPLIHAD